MLRPNEALSAFREKFNLGGIKLPGLIRSPLRKDSKASFSIFLASDGSRYLYKDHTTGESGSINSLLDEGKEKNKGVINRGQPFYSVFGGDKGHNSNSGRNISWNKKEISYVPLLEIHEKKYWNQYYITEAVLKKYNVSSISEYTIGTNTFSNLTNTFIYRFYQDNIEYVKIYSPYKSNYRWVSNTNNSIIQGLNQLPESGELLIVTKSLKDVMVLDLLGYHSIAPQSENTLIDLTKFKYEKILILFDNDPPGIHCAARYPVLFKNIFIPTSSKAKDISDYIKLYGVDSAKQLMYDLCNS